MTKENPWVDALMPFGENGRGAKPDAKALAALLRSGEEIPKGARDGLAELLDPQLRGALTVSWELRPVFTDRAKKTARDVDLERNLADALAQTGKSTTASMGEAAESVGMKERSAWTVWKRKILPRRRLAEEGERLAEILAAEGVTAEAFRAAPQRYMAEARRLLQKFE